MADNKVHLLQVIDDQKQDIEKYKTKLRDLVAAHRRLLKEKEALEQSLQALGAGSGSNETEDAKQVAALVSSLNTVTAAKGALEASLLADNKLLREEKLAAERARDDLVEKVKSYQLEMEEWKAKVMVERHERDKEQADHGAVMKELQQLLASERQLRMSAETTAADHGTISNDVVQTASLVQYKREIDKLQRELERTRRRLEMAESAASESPLELIQLQDEVRGLQAGHEAALQRERMRTQHTEERAKRHALAQEARIINLEKRLAELSNTVGKYDKIRLLHEAEICELRKKVALGEELQQVYEGGPESMEKTSLQENAGDTSTDDATNGDLSNVREPDDVHVECIKERDLLLQQLADLKVVESKEGSGSGPGPAETEESCVVEALEARIRVLTRDVATLEAKLCRDVDHYKQKLKAERAKSREMVGAAEAEWRGRLHLLEGQLEKLRDRSVALIREKDQQIQQLQTTLQSAVPGEAGEVPWHGPRMLHYASEVARRDVEMAALRRVRHNLEQQLREQHQLADTLRIHAHDLEEEVARLGRCQERGGANMEYLKNVVLNFLVSADPASKRHMCNAISAVLKLTPQEQQRIARQPHNSWYSAPG